MFSIDAKLMDWLLAGDPAIRWQVQRDLLGAKPAVYEHERAKVVTQGWGARLLAKQDKAGTWAKAIYSPKYISTHYTMLALRFLGLPARHPQAMLACKVLLEKGFLPDHGVWYAVSTTAQKNTRDHAETCVTGMALSIFSYFNYDDPRVDLIAEHLLNQQMEDHGWNCRSYRGDTHSSFNTTLLVLEGLREYAQFRSKHKLAIKEALTQGREFLLAHRLYKSHRTGKMVNSKYLRIPSHPGWQYNFLNALDHFQASGARRDERLSDGIAVLLKKRNADRTWNEEQPPGKRWFTMETAGRPGRWNTLRGLRVLKWWEEANL